MLKIKIMLFLLLLIMIGCVSGNSELGLKNNVKEQINATEEGFYIPLSLINKTGCFIKIIKGPFAGMSVKPYGYLQPRKILVGDYEFEYRWFENSEPNISSYQKPFDERRKGVVRGIITIVPNRTEPITFE